MMDWSLFKLLRKLRDNKLSWFCNLFRSSQTSSSRSKHRWRLSIIIDLMFQITKRSENAWSNLLASTLARIHPMSQSIRSVILSRPLPRIYSHHLAENSTKARRSGTVLWDSLCGAHCWTLWTKRTSMAGSSYSKSLNASLRCSRPNSTGPSMRMMLLKECLKKAMMMIQWCKTAKANFQNMMIQTNKSIKRWRTWKATRSSPWQTWIRHIMVKWATRTKANWARDSSTKPTWNSIKTVMTTWWSSERIKRCWTITWKLQIIHQICPNWRWRSTKARVGKGYRPCRILSSLQPVLWSLSCQLRSYQALARRMWHHLEFRRLCKTSDKIFTTRTI